MIRINLLPFREEKKKATVQRHILAGAVSLGLFLLILIGFHLFMVMGVSKLEAEVESARARLTALTKVTGDLEKFKADKEILKKKIGIITDLERGRSDAVHLLDELASRISPRTEWLTGVARNGATLRVEGMAVNNPAIAQFMKRLEESPYIGTVDLIASKQTTVSGVKLMGFVLMCTTEKG
jgi:type IV pilus assembly protein PilN